MEQHGSRRLSTDFRRGEKLNFDPVGHYSGPDVTQLHVNRSVNPLTRLKSEWI